MISTKYFEYCFDFCTYHNLNESIIFCSFIFQVCNEDYINFIKLSGKLLFLYSVIAYVRIACSLKIWKNSSKKCHMVWLVIEYVKQAVIITWISLVDNGLLKFSISPCIHCGILCNFQKFKCSCWIVKFCYVIIYNILLLSCN